jgi:deazaflavin-dependent oxidoreductase (nitroreductase family)
MLPSSLRYFFWIFNKLFMVPLFRIGLGHFWGNPIWGYMAVLKVKGRKSGKTRYSPVNYAIMNGCVYCVAGWGTMADWYKNMKVNPAIEIILPGGSFAGKADEVTDPGERAQSMRQVLKAGGLAGFLFGFNPYTISDADLENCTDGIPVMRVRPDGLGVGAGDYGGWLWVPVLLMVYWLTRR